MNRIKKNEVILSIDIGSKMGIAINVNGSFEEYYEYKFTNYYEFYKLLCELKRTWKPTQIIIPYPTRFYNTIIAHGKLMGVVYLYADRYSISVTEVNDSNCKKEVIRNGKKGKTTKQDIMDYFQVESEHVADAMMFTEAFLKAQAM